MYQINQNDDSNRRFNHDLRNVKPGGVIIVDHAERRSKEEPAKVVEPDRFLKRDDYDVEFPNGLVATKHFKGMNHAQNICGNVADEQRHLMNRWQSRETNKEHCRERSNSSRVELRNDTPPKKMFYDNSSNDFANPPRNVNVNRYDNMHHNEPRNNLDVVRDNELYGNSSSSSYYGTTHYNKNDHPTHSTGYSASNTGLQKDTGSLALKSFYGSSLQSYFNPPESDFCDISPDEYEANQSRNDFDGEQHTDLYDKSTDLYDKQACDKSSDLYDKSTDLYDKSPVSNHETPQYEMKENPAEPSGYFNSSTDGSKKDTSSLALKSFYGSSLESFFNPPENDFCNGPPDNLEPNQEGNDLDDEQHNDSYGNSSPSNYETSQSQTDEHATEPKGFSISCLDDFLNNLPDNLELKEQSNDCDDADNDFYDKPAPSDYETTEQEAKDHSAYSEEDINKSGAVEHEYDDNGQLPPKDYCSTSIATEDTFTDGSGNYSINDYGSNNYSTPKDGYPNNGSNNCSNSDHGNHNNHNNDSNNNSNVDDGIHNTDGNNYSNSDHVYEDNGSNSYSNSQDGYQNNGSNICSTSNDGYQNYDNNKCSDPNDDYQNYDDSKYSKTDTSYGINTGGT